MTSKVIQIRHVPEDVHRVLRSRAALAGLSLSDYARIELERLARRPTVAEVIERASRYPGAVRTDAIVAAVRSGRDRD